MSGGGKDSLGASLTTSAAISLGDSGSVDGAIECPETTSAG